MNDESSANPDRVVVWPGGVLRACSLVGAGRRARVRRAIAAACAATASTARTNRRSESAFQEVLGRASAATVRVLADGEEVALGAVVEPDGYLVTKASVLSGKITCRFKDGTEKEAKIVGSDDSHRSGLAPRRRRPTCPPSRGGKAVRRRREPGGDHGPGRRADGHRRAERRSAKDSRPRDPRQPRAWLGIGLGAGESGVGVDSVDARQPGGEGRASASATRSGRSTAPR